jgi:hypothetical protein
VLCPSGRRRTTPTSEYKRDQEQNDEYDKENPRYLGGKKLDLKYAKRPCDQGDHQKQQRQA